jgi:epoxyqueuosine reductase
VRLTEDDVAAAIAAAREAGFADARAVPLDDFRDAGLRGWLDAGFHGVMAYLERFLPFREAPRRAYPKYRAALVAFAEYGDAPNAVPAGAGRIARYALGRDYHDVLKARLRAVQRRLRERLPDLWTRPFVDTGPLNEKLAAAASGLGWVGKHTNVIVRGRGSYGVLSLLLLGADLPAPPAAAKDYCGRCTRCIAACPTGAIVAPYVLDARRCVSYLTIELQGPIPREFRAAIGDRIFGCDDCQEACPWNRFATRAPDEPFRPRDGLQGRPLAAWLALDAASFDETFRESAVRRAGYASFVRNVLVAAGNAAALRTDRALFDAVARRLGDPAPVVRGAAAWALGARGGADAAALLKERLPIENDADVLQEIHAALFGEARA